MHENLLSFVRMRARFLKILTIVFILGCFLMPEVLEAQRRPPGTPKKSAWRKAGRREKKNKYSFNPNLDKDTGKSKRLASKEMAKDNKKAMREQKKMIRREKRKLRRTKGAYRTK